VPRAAYIDPVSGIAGDMLLGALLDAGVERAALERELALLDLPGWRLEVAEVRRAGFRATQAVVHCDEAAPRRTLTEVLGIIEGSRLSPADRERAGRVFHLLGAAEAAVHGAPDAAASHLHEVGAVDALIDVVGAVVGLRLLGVQQLTCGPLPLGGGTVRSGHGWLPVPAPAVIEVAARAGIPLAPPGPAEPALELVTPTGAAIAGALATFERPPLRLERVGIGAGSRDPEGWPNILRLWVGTTPIAPGAAADPGGAPAGELAARELVVRALVLLETTVDDMPAEHIPYLDARLREAGALDAWTSVVQMKKGRPGFQLTAIAPPEAQDAVVLALLRHSSTLGVRVTPLLRYEAEREELAFECSLGLAVVKVKRLPGGPSVVAPEYEVCRLLADQHGLPLAEVYRIVTAEALLQLGS